MRIIKFRGKSKKDGTWFYGNLFDKDTRGNTHIYTTKSGCLDVDPETVGQYTGRTDKNGKEIYEGDILLMDNTSDDELYNEVGFKDGCLGYMTETGEFLPFCDNRVIEEVVGNIYDNTELIK